VEVTQARRLNRVGQQEIEHSARERWSSAPSNDAFEHQYDEKQQRRSDSDLEQAPRPAEVLAVVGEQEQRDADHYCDREQDQQRAKKWHASDRQANAGCANAAGAAAALSKVTSSYAVASASNARRRRLFRLCPDLCAR